MNSSSSLWSVFVTFLRLGVTSFGGPTAHLGFFHEEFVSRKKWLTEQAYGDLLALCQFLPGPASSQVGFGIGLMRGGWAGGLLAWAGFTLPSAAIMCLFALGVMSWGSGGGWLTGLQLAVIAVIAKAVWNLASSLCPNRATQTMALAAAAVMLLVSGSIIQIGLMVAGALVGAFFLKADAKAPEGEAGQTEPEITDQSGGAVSSTVCLTLFVTLLVTLPIIAATSGPGLGWKLADSFYRTGSLVFGGGHVVLPLLQQETVEPGWVAEDTFLAGYGAAQAVPGPLFTFSAFVGTAASGVGMGLVALVSVFLPSWLLVGGLLPHWNKLRRIHWIRRALAGTNAVVVGLLVAALYHPAWTRGVSGMKDVAFVLVTFALLVVWKLPPWLVVVVAGIAGAVVLS